MAEYIQDCEGKDFLDEQLLAKHLATCFCLYVSQRGDKQAIPTTMLDDIVIPLYLKANKEYIQEDEEWWKRVIPEIFEQFKGSLLLSLVGKVQTANTKPNTKPNTKSAITVNTSTKNSNNIRIAVKKNEKNNVHKLLVAWLKQIKWTMNTNKLEKYLQEQGVNRWLWDTKKNIESWTDGLKNILHIPLREWKIDDGKSWHIPQENKLKRKKGSIQRKETYDFDKLQSFLGKIADLMYEDDTIVCYKYTSESQAVLIVVEIERLNGVNRKSIVVLCTDSQPRAIYVLKDVDSLEKFVKNNWYDFTIHDIYQCLIAQYKEKETNIFRVKTAHSDTNWIQEFENLTRWRLQKNDLVSHPHNDEDDTNDLENVVENTVENAVDDTDATENTDKIQEHITTQRVVNYILNPSEAIEPCDKDLIIDLKIYLHEYFKHDEETMKRLFSSSTYTKYAHKINKKLENNKNWNHKKFLQTVSYSDFLELFKDEKASHVDYAMHENYVQYEVIQLRELAAVETMQWILADIFCEGEGNLLAETLSTMQSSTFTQEAKKWNSEVWDELQKRRYIFDSIRYTKQYLWYST